MSVFFADYFTVDHIHDGTYATRDVEALVVTADGSSDTGGFLSWRGPQTYPGPPPWAIFAKPEPIPTDFVQATIHADSQDASRGPGENQVAFGFASLPLEAWADTHAAVTPPLGIWAWAAINSVSTPQNAAVNYAADDGSSNINVYVGFPGQDASTLTLFPDGTITYQSNFGYWNGAALLTPDQVTTAVALGLYPFVAVQPLNEWGNILTGWGFDIETPGTPPVPVGWINAGPAASGLVRIN